MVSAAVLRQVQCLQARQVRNLVAGALPPALAGASSDRQVCLYKNLEEQPAKQNSQRLGGLPSKAGIATLGRSLLTLLCSQRNE